MQALAVLLRDAGAGGDGYTQHSLQEAKRAKSGQANALQDWQPPGTGGSMPVAHLHASQMVTNKLWAKVFK